MITEPKLENRNAQRYLGIRTQAAVSELPTVIPQLHQEVYTWLKQQGVAPAGVPFIRYYVIDMEAKLDIEIGVPVTSTLPGDSRVQARVLPAGRYATLLHTGNYVDLVSANAALLAWAEKNGIEWQMQGEVWGARIEFYIKDPGNEPNPEKWETELAFLTVNT